MFSFLREIENRTGLPFEILKSGFRVINFCNEAVYIEGIKNILELSQEKIEIKIAKGIVRVEGKNLKIKDLDTNSLCIVGKIEKSLLE